MKMRWIVFIIKHPDNNSKKPAYLWHCQKFEFKDMAF